MRCVSFSSYRLSFSCLIIYLDSLLPKYAENIFFSLKFRRPFFEGEWSSHQQVNIHYWHGINPLSRQEGTARGDSRQMENYGYRFCEKSNSNNGPRVLFSTVP